MSNQRRIAPLLKEGMGLPCYERALRARINSVFKDIIQPRGDQVDYPAQYDRHETRFVFAEPTWQRMALRNIRTDPTEFAQSLPFLKPKGVAYYIPALLSSSLAIEKGSMARDSILFNLSYRELGRDKSSELAKRLTIVQKQVLLTYLNYAEAVDGTLESDYPGLLDFWEREVQRGSDYAPKTRDQGASRSSSLASVSKNISQKNRESEVATHEPVQDRSVEHRRLYGLIVNAFPRGKHTHEICPADVEIPKVGEPVLAEIEKYRQIRACEKVTYVPSLFPALSPAAFLFFLPGLMIEALKDRSLTLSALYVNILPFSLGFPTCDARYGRMFSDRLSLLSAEQKNILAQFWLYSRTFNADHMSAKAIASSTFWDRFL